MDMAELLGGLLKGKAGGKGGMGALLEGLLGGGGGGRPAPKTRQAVEPRAQPQQTHATGRRRHGHQDVGSVAREAYGRYERRGGRQQQAAEPTSELDNARAEVLVRAMVNAAKSDGKLDKKEQEAIFGQLGDVTEEEVNYLRAELAKPLDVREFSWSVPLGLEEQVYGFSVMAIGIDQQKEAKYLRELAHGLRIQPDDCNEIHNQLGAPNIF